MLSTLECTQQKENIQVKGYHYKDRISFAYLHNSKKNQRLTDKQNDLDDVNIFCGRDGISINKTQTYIKKRNILLDMLILPQPSHYTMPPHLPAHNSTHFINAITSNRLTSCILCHQFVLFDLVSS